LEDANGLFGGDNFVHRPFLRGSAARYRGYALLPTDYADAGTAAVVSPSELNRRHTEKKTRRRYKPAELMRAPQILIVDDNEEDAKRIAMALRNPDSSIGELECEIREVRDVASAREHLERDDIDLYILDLGVAERYGESADKEIGKEIVEMVIDKTSAGIIVCSGLAIDEEAPPLIEYGADDYVEKTHGFSTIAARVISVWRRVHTERRSKQSHSGRKFLIGDWMFTVGDRTITNLSGAKKKLSITEHILLRYLCVVENHAIDGEVFNIEVLRREKGDKQVRMDVFIPRLRAKLDDSIDLSTQGRTGVYKLLGVQEVNAL
jgi:DNA-binding response OmpR family regulator